MSGTEEDQKLLMKNCKINIKEEKDKVEASVVTTAKAGVSNTAHCGWGGPVNDSVKWDTSGIKIHDSLEAALLNEVEKNEGKKKTRRGKRGKKKGKVVAPDELFDELLPEEGLREKRIVEIVDDIENVTNDVKKLTVEEKKEVTDLVVLIDNDSDSDGVPPVDLDRVKCAGESDYESEESVEDAIMKKVEEEEWRMTNMEQSANKEDLISEDVVVEDVIVVGEDIIVEDET